MDWLLWGVQDSDSIPFARLVLEPVHRDFSGQTVLQAHVSDWWRKLLAVLHSTAYLTGVARRGSEKS